MLCRILISNRLGVRIDDIENSGRSEESRDEELHTQHRVSCARRKVLVALGATITEHLDYIAECSVFPDQASLLYSTSLIPPMNTHVTRRNLLLNFCMST